MARISKLEAGGSNRLAFLDMLAMSELGALIIARSDDGYNVIVGSTPQKLDLFKSYSSHPGKVVQLPKLGISSTAAGRYQILERYARHYIAGLNLRDFSPISQDKIALQLIRECKALDLIDRGQIAEAIKACRSRWASLPGAGYGQPEHKLEDLISHYLAAGGKLAQG